MRKDIFCSPKPHADATNYSSVRWCGIVGIVRIREAYSLGKILLTVGLALTTQVACSTLLGAALPMLASAAKMDPAIVASPAITTVVDVLGLFIYFGLAAMLLGI